MFENNIQLDVLLTFWRNFGWNELKCKKTKQSHMLVSIALALAGPLEVI